MSVGQHDIPGLNDVCPLDRGQGKPEFNFYIDGMKLSGFGENEEQVRRRILTCIENRNAKAGKPYAHAEVIRSYKQHGWTLEQLREKYSCTVTVWQRVPLVKKGRGKKKR